MKLLVTGAGKLGRPLLGWLAASGHTGQVLARRPGGDYGAGWEAIPGDLLDRASLAAACAGMEGVVHLAGVTHSNQAARYFAVNARGCENLVGAAAAQGVRRFVLVSTRAIHPDGGPYSRSKAEAEAAVRASELEWTVLRVAEVYGAAGGEAVSDLIRWVRRGSVVPVVGDGRYRLAPIFLDDALLGIARTVGEPRTHRRTYVLSGPEELSYRDLVRRLAAYYGVRRLRLHLPVAAVALLARLCRAAGVARPPLYVDQIPRLLSEKPFDPEPAARDLDLRPRRLESGLAALDGAPDGRSGE